MQQPVSTAELPFVCPRCAQPISADSCTGSAPAMCRACEAAGTAPGYSVAESEDLTSEGSESADDTLLEELPQLRVSLTGGGDDPQSLRGQMDHLQQELVAVLEERKALHEHLGAALTDRDTLAERLIAMDVQLQEELSSLRNEKAALASMYEASEEFARSAAERLGELWDLRDRHAALFRAHEELTRSAERHRAVRGELEAHVSLLQVQFEESVDHRRGFETAQQELQALREQLRASEQERVTLSTSLRKKDEELRQLRTEGSGETVSLARRVEELEAELRGRDRDLLESAQEALTLREETKTLHARIEHLGNLVQGRDRELKEAETRLKVIITSQASAEALAAKYVNGPGEEQAKAAGQDATAAELSLAQARIVSLEHDLAARRETLEEMQREVEKSWKAQEEASRRLAELEAEKQSTAAKLAAAASAERTYRTIIEQTKQAVEPLCTERDQLKAELERLREASRQVEQEMRAVRDERDGLRTSIEHLEAQMEDSFEHVRITEEQRDAARMELEATRAGLERTRQHVVVLQSRRDQMREEIARLKQALGVAPEPVH